MKWLSLGMVEIFHRESLVRFGGADGLRDAGLLDSALARPENVRAYEPDADVFRIAAVYCAGIVKNHPFIDGNKRTGTLAAIASLALNGISVEFVEAEIVAMIIGLAGSEIDEHHLAEWLRRSAV
ncbi:MAG: type II toxin-antitoxin system death-on-curing family toxin [Alphaproteobacteria bacterium]|nr:type II toxin-antitoxin system death-on-curing family toxin [Alphaproteobacteria bacterium]